MDIGASQLRRNGGPLALYQSPRPFTLPCLHAHTHHTRSTTNNNTTSHSRSLPSRSRARTYTETRSICSATPPSAPTPPCRRLHRWEEAQRAGRSRFCFASVPNGVYSALKRLDQHVNAKQLESPVPSRRPRRKQAPLRLSHVFLHRGSALVLRHAP